MPANTAFATLLADPVSFARVATNLAQHAWVYPTNPAQTAFRFPGSNTRQIIILNTGNNPLLFGLERYDSIASIPGPPGVAAPNGRPYDFSGLPGFALAVGSGPNPNEGSNCTRVPVGGSLSVELGSFQDRGNFDPTIGVTLPGSIATGYPAYLIFFSAVGGDTTADVTYVNKFGTF